MSSSSLPFQLLQTNHQNPPIKAWKSLLFPTNKPIDLLLLFLKAGLILSTFFLVSLLFFLSHSYHHTLFQHSLQLSVPHGSYAFNKQKSTNISHIVFGIGSSVETWQNRYHYNELWWQPNVTRGFVWLEQEIPTNQSWPETSIPYKVSGNTSSFKYTCPFGSRSVIRITRIVKEIFEIGLPNVRWFVMGDDDTMFFTENLVNVLAKYDHNEMYYIGGNSESVEQNLIHSFAMAYGGGGFAVSYPLAAELVKILDRCIDRYAIFYGSDQKIQACISEIGVQVTKELGFHQVDIRGNLYGLLAAHPVAPLVSLHHLDYVESMFPNTTRVDSVKKLVSAYKTDPGRTLQQSICYDLRRNWSVSVSWGYSVELYSTLVMANELETPFRTFKTWRSWSNDPFTFNTRPMSPDPCVRPLVFFLDRVENVGERGHTRSAYKRYDDDSRENVECVLPALDVQFVNVSAPHFKPELWKKAPRRQCCNVIEGGDEASNVVQIEIRSCHRFESATPP
ncbi:uncharacterized protein LOC133314421 [Gastrolobium bilobum]|uniref:uncharacterized protein LOC133314421 n=1 Tax=Gastrolobium bilobum TaxID=150636 RepID=UPI002AB31A4C|nr:uncharacterized protein LOC133314421 [Gastrolobium bilobum]